VIEATVEGVGMSWGLDERCKHSAGQLQLQTAGQLQLQTTFGTFCAQFNCDFTRILEAGAWQSKTTKPKILKLVKSSCMVDF